MARILRGEVRWADLSPGQGREQTGRRPVLIISHNVFNERSGTVIAMAITSQLQKAGFPLAVEIASKGLPRKSWIKIGQVRTLAAERIGKLVAVLSPEELDRAIEGLNEIIESGISRFPIQDLAMSSTTYGATLPCFCMYSSGMRSPRLRKRDG